MRAIHGVLVSALALAGARCDASMTGSTTGLEYPVGHSHGGEDEHGDDDHDDHHDEGEEHHHHHMHIVLTPEVRRDAARILLLQSSHTDRITEVVGVVDVHADSGDQDDAMDELRAEALAMGADAVLGVEFHHGETHHAPTHLSGLAVRFLRGTIP
jgi:hypothetical protein